MNDSISFIPLIELPYLKNVPNVIEPSGNFNNNKEEWEEYFKKMISFSYPNVPDPINKSVKMYRLFDLEWETISKAIQLHKGDMHLNDSCSLFGGYAIEINGDIVLYPQCCGLLEEINDLLKLKTPSFEPFYLTECHPSPKFSKVEDEVIIECSGEFESFFPKTESKIIIPYNGIVEALEKVVEELQNYSTKLDQYSSEYDVPSLSEILIWGRV
ncbi:MAG: hypothetical protein WDZ35_06150 [Crocinitomicaceae bacterium]